MNEKRETRRARILRAVASLATRHAVAVLVVAGLLTAFSIGVIAWRGMAGISTDVMDIIPRESEEGELYRELIESFASSLYVAVESDDPAHVQAARPFVERFAAKLASIKIVEPEIAEAAVVLEGLTGRNAAGEPTQRLRPDSTETERTGELIERAARAAAGRGDTETEAEANELSALLNSAARSGPLHEAGRSRAWELFERTLNPGRVRSVTYRAGEGFREFVETTVAQRGYLFLDAEGRSRLAEKLKPESIDAQMAKNRENYLAVGTDYLRRIARDPLDLIEVLREHRARFGSGAFRPREGSDLLVSPDGTLMLMIVHATKPAGDLAFDRAFMEAARLAEREAWDELQTEDAQAWSRLRELVRVGYAGRYAATVSENRIFVRDIRRTFPVSLLGVLLLFIIVFRRPGAISYLGTPLVASILWTVMVAFLAFKQVSGMSCAFAAMLAGLSIDYAVHLYNRYVAERGQGLGVEEAIRGSIIHVGSGIFFGGLTTAVAFFGCVWTRFTVLRELAFLAGIGVLFGMAAMLLVQPAMLVVRSRARQEPPGRAHVASFGLRFLARLTGRAPWALFVASTAVVVGAAVYSLHSVGEDFFDHDFMRMGAENPAIDLSERIQKKFGTNLSTSYVLSRGNTAEEALEKANLATALAHRAVEGDVVASSPVEYGASAALRPSIKVEGCTARLKRVQIRLPEGEHVPDLAEGTEVATRPDGSRLIVYGFKCESEMVDWEITGDGRFFSSIELADGSTARWRHSLSGAVEVRFSVWFQGQARAVTLGLGKDLRLRAVAPSRGGDPEASEDAGSPWPPRATDQVGMSIRGDPEEGLVLFAGRGTIVGIESLTRYVPPISEQKKSAGFIADIDVDALDELVGEVGRKYKFKPRLFGRFFDGRPPRGDRPGTVGLRHLVERARNPRFLTIGQLERSGLGVFVPQFYRHDPEAEGERRHTVATRLFPERGELPVAWYERVRAAVGPAGRFVSSQMVSYEMRRIVYEDLIRIMMIVLVGVAASLLWSFKSVWWSLAALMPVASGLAVLVATLLLIQHPFNYVNILVLPVIVGIGIDDGIHVIHRFRHSARVHEIITETGRALVMTTLTTMIGFGALMISRYRGLASLGFVATMGMFLCLYTSLVMLPALLVGLANRRRMISREGNVPAAGTNADQIRGGGDGRGGSD